MIPNPAFERDAAKARRPSTSRWAYLVVTRRMIAKMKLILLVLSAVLAVEVSADNGSSLNGTWVVDVAATERSVLEMAPRADAKEIARNFLVMGGYLAITMLVIEDDFATYAMYGDTSGKGAKFKLVSQNQTERKYIATDKDSSRGTLTVTVLSGENIRVSQQNDPLGTFVLWKRTSPPPIRTSEALDAHLSIWQASLEKIKNHLFVQDIQQTEAVPPKRWSEDVVLQDGRRIKVEREVSYTFKHSIGDAGSGFSVFKNILSNHRLQFKHPDTGKFIVWQGDPSFTPVLLDVIDGASYLVLSARPTKETERVYGCTELPFIYLQYDTKSQGKWRTVPEDRAPRTLKRANLSFAEKTKLKDHLSVDEVQETIAQNEKSSDRFFQREIPKDYSEWRYLYKNSYRNERRRDDCRPPRAPLPQMALPAPIEGSPEILEAIDYTPNRIAIGDAWSDLVFDRKREGECKKLFRPTDPDDYMQGQRFVNDSSGRKPAPYSRTTQFNMGVRLLCDDDDVWFVTHQEEPGKIVISKFTITGDLVFRTSFRNPDRVEGFIGYIRVPSLRSEGGYLYFDWLDFRDINREWHIKRWLKMRMREPDMPNPSINSDAAR